MFVQGSSFESGDEEVEFVYIYENYSIDPALDQRYIGVFSTVASVEKAISSALTALRWNWWSICPSQLACGCLGCCGMWGGGYCGVGWG